MLVIFAIILFAVWILGWTVWHVASAAIHILPAIAVIALVIHFVRSSRGAGSSRPGHA